MTTTVTNVTGGVGSTAGSLLNGSGSGGPGGGLLGGVTSTVGNVTGGVGSTVGSLLGGSGSGGPGGGLLGGVTSTVGNVTGGLLGGSGGGLIGGLTTTVGNVLGGLTPTLVGTVGGLTSPLTNLVSPLLGSLTGSAGQLLTSLAQTTQQSLAGLWPTQLAGLGPNNAPATDKAVAGALPASLVPAQSYHLASGSLPAGLSARPLSSPWLAAVSHPFGANGFNAPNIPDPLSQTGSSSGAGFGTGITLLLAVLAGLFSLALRKRGRVWLPPQFWQPFAFISLLERPG